MSTVLPVPAGWNTWDVRHHTGMSHLPSGPRVRFGLVGEDGPVVDGFTWRDGLVRLGHHAVDGSFAEVTVEAGGVALRLAFGGGTGDVLHATAETAGAAVLVVEGGGADGDGGWDVDVSPATEPATRPDGARVWTFPPGGAAVRVAPPGTPGSVADTPGALAARRAGAEAARLRSSGWLGDAADALTRAVTWNTVYAPGPGRVMTVTSRDFVSAERRGFYGTWALHAWDTFFTGLAATAVDRAYARGVFGQILPHATASGMIPNRVSDERGRTDDRSQPPVGALTVYRAYLAGGLSHATRDRALLEETFPALLAWHDWWPRARRGPHGLLAWGSDPVEGDAESATLDRAKRESGLDDSPMYDEAAYDPATGTMDLADVGLNALHIADAEALADIAGLLGDAAAECRLRAEAAGARAAVDALLWDEEAGGYRNLRAAGGHDPHVAPTLLYPLLAGVPDEERARAVAEALLRPGTLGGERPLPSVARDDPGFAATYWRGRIWAPMAYLAVEGLRRYGLRAASRPVVDALLRLFLDEWRLHSHVRENYPAAPDEDLTGLPARSDGLMAWGGLLGHLAFGELADAAPGGWRFAHPGEPAGLTGLPLGEGRLSVDAGDRLTVSLDGLPLLDASPSVVISGYERTATVVRGTAEGTGDVLVTPPGGGAPVRLAVEGDARRFEIPGVPRVPGPGSHLL
ncbi:MGH1-like glycoside hydrolase domain-containing protein [Streptomyces sp. SBT349]|uniref:MGH1-like glycoside hydrolase domain-containing protein n=1 Tax=Streptomyces sp. SBT349 TaxID=1580539 RepID=UPI00069D0614|nr:trehalase family glycosidase [Streptomyces sp. SBT349]